MIKQIPGLDYSFKDPDLLELALTHRSFGPLNNERLEFLGDAVLGMVVAEALYHLHDKLPEGALTRLRAAIVRGETLADMAQELGLETLVQVSNAEKKSGARRRRSILADTLEAIFGAIYLDGGIAQASRVIKELTASRIAALPDPELLKDPKTRLQEWLQARGRSIPEYRVLMESGADHAKHFEVECRLSDAELKFTAQASSRRKAQQAAAVKMLTALVNS